MTAYRDPAARRVRATTAPTLTATFDADPGATTVTITRGDGSALVKDAPASGTAEARSLALTRQQTAAPDRLTATWQPSAAGVAPVEQAIEIVGDDLFTIAEARAARFHAAGPPDGAPPLADATKFPDARLIEARDRIADAFEAIAGMPFFPRYRREVLDGDGTAELLVPTPALLAVRAVELRRGAAWEALDPATVLADPAGACILRTAGAFPAGRRNVRLAYEHGHPAVPAPIRRAALRLLMAEVVPSGLPDRAVTQVVGQNVYRLAVAGERGAWFGIPEVDATLRQYVDRLPGVA